MKLIQDDFRDRAYDNAYKMLDDSAREVGAMLSSYGVLIASAWDVVRFVRVYEGELEKEASDWLETARLANTSGYSDPKKAKHRKDLGATLQHLRQLQHFVKLAKRAHPNPSELITGPLAPMIAPASPVIAKITRGSPTTQRSSKRRPSSSRRGSTPSTSSLCSPATGATRRTSRTCRSAAWAARRRTTCRR